MHTPPYAEYTKLFDRTDWRGVGELMLASANKLAKAGADFLICPDNTIHKALPYIEQRLPLPWMHIAEVVAAEADDMQDDLAELFAKYHFRMIPAPAGLWRAGFIQKSSRRGGWSSCVPMKTSAARCTTSSWTS